MATTIRTKQINYPDSDGKPMGETDWHRICINRLIDLLTNHFRDRNAYVSGNLLLYYEEGNPKKFVVPDVFLVKDLYPSRRRTYQLWVEGRVPDAIIEVTSRKTRKRDEFEKPALYEQLGVRELFLFDPLVEYLEAPLIGYRLNDGRYQRIPLDATGAMKSEEFGLVLRNQDGVLQLFDPETNERLLDTWERADCEAERADHEAERADSEAERAALAEHKQRLAEEREAALQAELDRLRSQLGK